MKRNYWTNDELMKLRSLYPDVTIPIKDIATLLGRSPNTIYNKAKYMFLVRKGWEPANKTRWSKQDLTFLQENFYKLNNVQLAKALKKKLTVVRNMCRELGLKRIEMEYWTPDQVTFLKSNYKFMGDTELAEVFASTWDKKKGWTKKHIEKKRRYLKLKRSTALQQKIKARNVTAGRFSVSHWKRWLGRTASVGEIRIWLQNKRLVKYIKTEKGFLPAAPVIWAQTFGSIPPGHVVWFKDLNPLNCAIENLECISRAESAKRTSVKVTQNLCDNYVAGIMSHNDPDLRKLIKQNPDLIQIKKTQLLSNRKLNQL